jgi:hypothetical protein
MMQHYQHQAINGTQQLVKLVQLGFPETDPTLEMMLRLLRLELA